MNNIKDDAYYIEKIKKQLDVAINIISKVKKEEFIDDDLLLNAVMFSFVQISEYSLKLTDEYIKNHPNVEWHQIKGIRNKIVHDYDGINYELIYDYVVEDFPKFRASLNC